MSGRVVVITGAGTGIGAACARRFASQGDRVVLIGRRREPLERLRPALRQPGRSGGADRSAPRTPGAPGGRDRRAGLER